MPIPAGDLNVYVVLERRDELSDGQGGLMLSDWVYVDEVWASIRALRARERLEAHGDLATITHRIRIRWRDDLTARMRVVLGSRYFLLEGPPRDVDESREVLEFMATETA